MLMLLALPAVVSSEAGIGEDITTEIKSLDAGTVTPTLSTMSAVTPVVEPVVSAQAPRLGETEIKKKESKKDCADSLSCKVSKAQKAKELKAKKGLFGKRKVNVKQIDQEQKKDGQGEVQNEGNLPKVAQGQRYQHQG